MFTTLYLSAYHLGSLFFSFINKAFPDPAARFEAQWVMDSMRWSAASLVIAFPVFLFMSHRIHSAIARDPVKRLSPIRRWLTYLTLFIAASILIGDLTTLVYNLLGGELTARFILKVMTVGADRRHGFRLLSAGHAPGGTGMTSPSGTRSWRRR